VTYPLHVILRYRLEKAMLAGDLEVADLPGAWNEGMRELLGLNPPDDRLGCLQDIHWSVGAIGYFPCYTLGAIMAAQLFGAASAAEPDILPAVGRGDFGPLLGWLRANVHEQGSLLDMPELLTRATGRPLELHPFLDHLRERYLA
jgi:carboxypeptidase Taq